MSLPYDIARCDGGNCPSRHDCQRFTDISTGPITFFMSPPINVDKCVWQISQVIGQGVETTNPRAVTHGV